MDGKVVKTFSGPQTTIPAGQTTSVKASARVTEAIVETKVSYSTRHRGFTTRGATTPSRNGLSNANKERSDTMAEQLFWKPLEHLQTTSPGFRSGRTGKRLAHRFKCAIHVVDATTLQLVASALARHGMTHVFNSGEEMPSVSEQMFLPGSRTNPQLVAARFLLKPGRKNEDAVKTFQPYDRVQEEKAFS